MNMIFKYNKTKFFKEEKITFFIGHNGNLKRSLKKISLWFGLLQTIFIYCILNKVIWLKRIEGPKIRDSECENGLEIYARFLFKALK